MLLKVHNLTKKFNGREILKSVDFEVDQGEVVVIIGPSGSGKTTMLRNLNFLERADQGELEFDGEKIDLSKPSHHQIVDVRKKYCNGISKL